MRPIQLVRFVRPLVVTAVAVGCIDGRSPTAPSRLGPTSVGIRMSVSASHSAPARSLKVVATYARSGAPTAMRGLDSTTVLLSVGDSAIAVQLDIGACLRDPDRELPSGESTAGDLCLLHLGVTLFDDAKQIIDQTTLAAIAARAGQPATAPAFVMGPHPKPADAIAAGQAYSCMLTDRGAAYCWGANAIGQLGTGDTVSSLVPRAVAGGLRFARIAIGSGAANPGGIATTCGLALGGAIYCWGLGSNGQLGNGSTASSSSPVPVAGGLQFQSISVGSGFACAVTVTTQNGYCWGRNAQGALGTGDTVSVTVPTAVVGGLKFADIRVGLTHTCGLAIGAPSPVYCWGGNQFRSVNNTTTASFPTPTPIATVGGSSIVAALVGGVHSCALAADGSAQCWGTNEFGQLGLGGTPGSGSGGPPTTMVGGVSFAGLALSIQNNIYLGSCGWTAAGAAYCWGPNDSGQLGSSAATSNCTFSTSTFGCTGVPVRVDGADSFVAMASGGQHTCGLTRDHRVLCWGLNSSGQLGTGTTVNASVPTQVLGGYYTP